MSINWFVVLGCCLIPLVVGFIWYNPKVFGKAWMQASGMTEEKAKGANMPLVFGITLLMSIMLSTAVLVMVVHQIHVGSIFADDTTLSDPNSASSLYLKNFFEQYGHKFRTFKHGVFHGVIGGFFIALPIICTNALFERKGFRYIAINVGYWVVCIALIGGVISQFA